MSYSMYCQQQDSLSCDSLAFGVRPMTFTQSHRSHLGYTKPQSKAYNSLDLQDLHCCISTIYSIQHCRMTVQYL